MGDILRFPTGRVVRRIVDNKPDIADVWFALDMDAFRWVLNNLGCDPAMAYFVISRGATYRDRTSSWSTASVERHTGMTLQASQRAVDLLVRSNTIVPRQAAERRPEYVLNRMSSYPDMARVSMVAMSGVEQARMAGDRRMMIERLQTHLLPMDARHREQA